MRGKVFRFGRNFRTFLGKPQEIPKSIIEQSLSMASTLFDVLKQRAVFDFEINFTSNANRELNLIAMAKPAEAKVKLEKCFEQTFWAEDEAELNSTSKSSPCRVPDFPFLRFRITRFERFVSF